MGNVQGLLRDEEIRWHGKEWLATVADNDGTSLHWKPLDDWTQEFEPVKQESQREKEIKEAFESKATQVLLNTIDRRMVARILRLILDVSSQILTQAESKLPENSATARILNNVNGILLSFRFEHSSKEYKLEYFRRTATNNLTATLWEYLPDEHTADALLKMQQHVKETLLYLQDEVRPVVNDYLDTIFLQVNERIDERVEEGLGDTQVSLAFEERLMQVDAAANQVTEGLNEVTLVADKVAAVADETVNGIAGGDGLQFRVQETVAECETVGVIQTKAIEVNIHDKAVKVEQEVIASREVALQKKTQVLASFTELIKSHLFSKMDQLTVRMVDSMDHLFLAFYEIHLFARVAETKGTNTLEGLQMKMFDKVQLLAVRLKEQVEAEVQLVTETLGAMMVHPQENEDKEAEKLEDEGEDLGNK